jgi:hypothetical protein
LVDNDLLRYLVIYILNAIEREGITSPDLSIIAEVGKVLRVSALGPIVSRMKT